MPANTHFERLPPRYRDCGNSAAMRRAPGAAPRSAPHRSRRRRRRAFRKTSRQEQADGPDFIGAAGIGLGEVARKLQRLLQSGDVDDIEAEQLLLGFGIRSVDHQRRLLVLVQCRRRRRRQQADRGAEPALLRKLVVNDIKPRHHRIVLFLGPGENRVFIVVAKQGVEHAAVPVWWKTKEVSRCRQDHGNKFNRERVNIYSVVPAKAGTHNPWRWLLQKAFAPVPKRGDTAYGSPPAG